MTNKHPKKNERPGVDKYGRTPLHYAASEKTAVILDQLISNGLNLNLQDDNGWTPLHFASQANSIECVRSLLNAGAEISLKDSNGNTPLGKAVFNSMGDGTMIKMLLEAGADPYALNNYDVSPISLAKTIANFNVEQFFER